MTRTVVRRLLQHGINVKGYFILGLPTETREEIQATVRLVHDLWELADQLPGRFRASAFEYRPYPGTPDWQRLLATGRYTPEQLLNYTAVDLTDRGIDETMRERDELNFSVKPPTVRRADRLRPHLSGPTRPRQHARTQAAA